jgi:hypothetical protein
MKISGMIGLGGLALEAAPFTVAFDAPPRASTERQCDGAVCAKR